MRMLFALVLALGLAAPACADFVLEPDTLPPGGVALLCWQGEDPPALTAVTFEGATLARFFRDDRPCALVGVDLAASPGLRPLTIVSERPGDRQRVVTLALRIEGVERPAQRLTLPKQMVTPTVPKIVKQIEIDRKRLDRIFARKGPVAFDARFVRPVSGEVISAFGLRRILNGIEKTPHNGIDFRAAQGTPIAAMARGAVALADELYYTGKTVVIDHGGGLFSLYAHLDALAVAPEAMVDAGEVVGTVGSTGRSTGPHLHLGARLGAARIDPLALLALFVAENR